ncbi:hypothetical protein AcV7_004695 [Taiwanofungus camphoratus]|nr:hypothetical protein AcV7_004695 [Antrodia cinnamomea]
MDASDESRWESQASQFLQTVLRPSTTTASQRQCETFANRVDNDMFEGSSSVSSSRNSFPQYHFHGLAVTQTDSQYEGQVRGGDSQKENAASDSPVHSSSIEMNPSNTTAIVTKEQRQITKDIISRVPLSNPGTSSIKTAKAVSFVSPVASIQTTPQRQGNVIRTNTAPAHGISRARKQRSPSPASQDSFVGPFSYRDPERLFLESTRAFNVPLSELGCPTANIEETLISSSSRMSPMYVDAPKGRRVAAPIPGRPLGCSGEVLVAATPSSSSTSDSSQGASSQQPNDNLAQLHDSGSPRQCADTQLSDLYLQGQPQTLDIDHRPYQAGPSAGAQSIGAATFPSSPGDASTEPSSSYERLLNMDPFEPNLEPLPATQVATQSHDLEATQLIQQTQLTQSADPACLGPSNADASMRPSDRHGPFDPFVQPNLPTLPPSARSTDTTVTVPRSVIGLVDPSKKWRLHGYNFAPDTSNVQAGVSAQTTPPMLSIRPQDTQPSDISAVNGSVMTDVPRGLPPSSIHRQPVVSRGTDVGVVPDSEPIESNKLPGRSRQRRSISAVLDAPSEGEVIPESLVATEDQQSDRDENDEDVPLATVVQLARKERSKGKGRAGMAPNTLDVPSSRTRTVSNKETPTHHTGVLGRGQNKANAQSVTGQVKGARPRETSVVPSSNPHQDNGSTFVTTNLRSTAFSTRKSSVPAAKAKSRSTTPALATRSRRTSTNTSSDEETAVSKDANATIPGTDGEMEIELADTDDMDVDKESVAPSELTRKRKRAVSSTSRRPTSRVSARAHKVSMTTPLTRTSKRVKTSSSISKGGDPTATRVFALWKQDGHYYAGTIHSLITSSPARYLIKFDDGTEDTVDISKLRLCKLSVGDHIILIEDGQKAEVVDDKRFDAENTVTVQVDNGDELELLETQLQDVRIASRTLLSEWKNRTLTVDAVTPVVRPKALKSSPSPSNLTLGSAGSINRGRKLLAKTGLVVTLSLGNSNWEKEKDRLMQAIKNNGGTVIDDWSHIFTMEGTHSQNNKRWVVLKETVKWTGRDDIGRVFLLSDDANQKPKFLMALALGIPCLSIEWLQQTVNERIEKDWQSYLLPAGFSDVLNARVSQMVDLDWGNSIQHLTEIMSNTVAFKLFTNLSILCVAPEFVPLPARITKRSSSDTEKAKEASRMVPRIILSMGASRVEAVHDIKHASSSDLSQFDYVVVKEFSDVARLTATLDFAEDVNCVHLGWVKDCLIAGRLLSRPEY